MRLFLRHVAPGWLGESTAQNSRTRGKRSNYAQGSSHLSSELQTIGSKGINNKSHYNIMDDEVITLASEEGAHAGWQDDKDSERGIVPQRVAPEITITQEVVVESTPTNKGGHDRESWKDTFE